MILMTSRSSRFFVVLLHLVGVSTHLPSSLYYFSSSGIVGVNPLSIVLETLDPSLLLEDAESRLQLLQQPHWIQDVSDQTCLDPMGGFSECGDATLWMIVPKQSTPRQSRWRKWIMWATEEDDADHDTLDSIIEGYSIQLVDHSYTMQQHQRTEHGKGRTDELDSQKLESITSSPAPYVYYHPKEKVHGSRSTSEKARECLTRRRKDNELVLAPCFQDRAWAWQFNEHGILHFQKSRVVGAGASTDFDRTAGKRAGPKQKRLLKKRKTLECFGRNSSHAVLLSCNGQHSLPSLDSVSTLSSPNDDTIDFPQERVVQVALVRQSTASTQSNSISKVTIKNHFEKDREPESLTIQRRNEHGVIHDNVMGKQEDSASMSEPVHHGIPPSRIDIAHSHASGPAEHMELKVASRLNSLWKRASPTASTNEQTLSPVPLAFFKDSNPILLASSKVRGTFSKESGSRTFAPEKVAPSPSTATSPIAPTTMKPKIRKIQMNPYIASSTDERWTDPQTGLVYRTDLCRYLGHERSEVGRHTLVGVGQYTKTVFNIKVYGVALYVSKRDVLGDPSMTRFATMTSEELRHTPDFYDVMRLMTPHAKGNAGSFDRTIFLKINMQLGTDTMRSSLDADWKMLTQEDKDLLIGSSMKPRPASDTMMNIIQSPDNPNRCSCAQIAPPEYNSDPNCCARGTELVFTWRKNGDLEVRLNGDFMDTFARPDIAAAIFFEYLRLDDPMSIDFLDRAVDGWPMLLGPLSQVKGISSPVMAQSGYSTTERSSGNNPFFRAIEGFGGALSSGANNVAGFVQNGAAELGNGAITAARSMGDAARNLGEEVERKRDLIGKHVSQFAHQTISKIYTGKEQKALTTLPKWLETLPIDIPGHGNDRRNQKVPRGRVFKSSFLSRMFGMSDGTSIFAPDEIVPMIYPSTNSTQRLFLGMVHLYLLLMLIVSFPTHLSTRTKMVSTRKSKHSVVQPISDTDSDEGSSAAESDNVHEEMPAVVVRDIERSRLRRGFQRLRQRDSMSSSSRNVPCTM